LVSEDPGWPSVCFTKSVYYDGMEPHARGGGLH